MQDFLPFIVIGLTAGSVYGLAGTGLVLTYKTSGVFNFAYGAIAAVAAYVFYWLHVQEGMSWQLAALLCLVVLGPLMGLLLELLTRMLSEVGTQYQIVGMIGLTLGIAGVLTLWGNSWSDPGQYVQFPDFLPTETFTVFDVNVGYNQLITMLIALVSAIGLYLFFRWSRLGVGMRAVVDNPDLVNICGHQPVAGAPVGLGDRHDVRGDVGSAARPHRRARASRCLILLVVQAFGAAAVGYFSNLPLTYIGGLLIGIAAALSTKYVNDITWLGGLPPSIPFIVLFVALLVTPRRLLALRRTPPAAASARVVHAPAAGEHPRAPSSLVAVLLFIPDLVGVKLAAWTVALLYVILFLSLGLLVRTSGQVSLAQLGLAAVGAAAFGHLVSDHHVPWLPALLLAGLIAVPVGAIIAIPAIRLSGVFLALATLGFGIMLEQMFYTQDIMFGPTSAGVHRNPPQHRAVRPRLLLRGPRRGGVVFDLRGRAHARPPRPAAARALRLAACARHPGHHHQPHPSPRLLHLRVPGRDLRRALRRLRRVDQRHLVPGLQFAHHPGPGRPRARWRAVVRDHRRGGVPADPGLRHRH